MEKVKKEEGFLRKFINSVKEFGKWLKGPDVPEVDGGKINPEAFNENPKILEKLMRQQDRIDRLGAITFGEDKRAERAKTVKEEEIKAEVSTPKLEKQKEHSEDRVRE